MKDPKPRLMIAPEGEIWSFKPYPTLADAIEVLKTPRICCCNHLKTTHAHGTAKCLWPGCECVCFVEGK